MSSLPINHPAAAPAAVVPTIRISGTGPSSLSANLYYKPIQNHREDAKVPHKGLAIPRRGLWRCDDAYSELEADMLEWMDDEGHEQADVIGHSQGGLYARMFGCRQGHRTRKVVSVSGPHGGTLLAPQHLPFFPAVRFMATGSRFNEQAMEEYLAVQASDGPKPQFFSIYTVFDGLVWPTRSSYLPGAMNYCLAPRWMHPHIARKLPDDVRLLHAYVNHLDEIWSPRLRQLLGTILDGPVSLPA